MKKIFQILLIFITFFACKQESEFHLNNKTTSLINPDGKTIETRFLTPSGYRRITLEQKSYGKYLKQLPLKPHGAIVSYYNGSTKQNNAIYDAVVNLNIGNKNLHQCADAVMRLRADYFWSNKLYNKIHFNFTNGFKVDYSEWIKGKRIIVNGNKTIWKQSTKPSNTYKDYWNYLEIIFMYAGTRSLSKELKSIEIDDMKVGDVFIKGGSPGHAIIIVDMATNINTKDIVFLLAQSYMPAQDIQILKNRNNKNISPWYSVNFGNKLKTPEWTFERTDLKRFQ